jgi:hypothetical protein
MAAAGAKETTMTRSKASKGSTRNSSNESAPYLSEYGQVGVGWADPGKERAEPLTLRPR